MIYSALLVSVRITNRDPRENDKSIPYHRDLFEAIARKDGDRAEKMTEELLSDASRRLESEFS